MPLIVRGVYRHKETGTSYLVLGISGDRVITHCVSDGTIEAWDLPKFEKLTRQLTDPNEAEAGLLYIRMRQQSKLPALTRKTRFERMLAAISDEQQVLKLCLQFLQGTPLENLP